jgi:hypothetical protein
MAEQPERSTPFQDPEMETKLKVKLLARQREVSAVQGKSSAGLLTMIGRGILANSYI